MSTGSGGRRFDGRVGFVSGGGTGIGFACARAIVEDGGSVMIAGRREDVLRQAAAALGAHADAVRCDVTDDASVEAAVAAAVARFGPLTLAVNAAGMGAAGTVLNSTADVFAMVLDTNLVGAFRCMRAEARAMRAAGGGSIVNISSIAAVLTHRWMTAYCASKAGLNMLTRCAADDLGEHGIRVNAIMPSLVPTELASPLAGNDVARNEYLRLMPISRLGTPEDVACAAVFLLSNDATWITGQCLGVDGGHTIRQGPDLVPVLRQYLPDES
jgi:NAD(P)-dependent dehydrogenase (short-subunit alcohol dehydrogenase family)